jgi:hypothetical protein
VNARPRTPAPAGAGRGGLFQHGGGIHRPA